MLPYSRLSWGNGILELTTLLAAILGSLAGGLLAQGFRGRQICSGLILLGLSLAGLLVSKALPNLPAADPARKFPWNWPAEFWNEWRTMRQNAELKMAVLANAFFWFLGALLLLNIVLHAADVLHVDEAHSSYLLASLGLGIGTGSFLAGFLSGSKIEPGMILPGLAGVHGFCMLLSWPGLSYISSLALLIFVGISGGFFVVPVNAWIQQIPRPEEKGRVIAVASLLSFIGLACSRWRSLHCPGSAIPRQLVSS